MEVESVVVKWCVSKVVNMAQMTMMRTLFVDKNVLEPK